MSYQHHHHHHNQRHIFVQIPFNIYPGEYFDVQLPSGNITQIIVPYGSVPGSQIEIINPEYREIDISINQPLPYQQQFNQNQYPSVKIQESQPYNQQVIVENINVDIYPNVNTTEYIIETTNNQQEQIFIENQPRTEEIVFTSGFEATNTIFFE